MLKSRRALEFMDVVTARVIDGSPRLLSQLSPTFVPHRMFVSLSLALLWHSSRLLNSQATQRFYSKKAPSSAEYRRYRYTSDPCACHLPFTPRIIPADGTRLWRSNYLSYLLRGRSRTLPTQRMRVAVQRTSKLFLVKSASAKGWRGRNGELSVREPWKSMGSVLLRPGPR